MKQKQKYVAPGLTVVQFKAERGFAESNKIFGAAQQINMMIDDQITMQMQDADKEFTAGYFDNQDMSNPTGNWVYDGNGGAGGSWF